MSKPRNRLVFIDPETYLRAADLIDLQQCDHWIKVVQLQIDRLNQVETLKRTPQSRSALHYRKLALVALAERKAALLSTAVGQ